MANATTRSLSTITYLDYSTVCAGMVTVRALESLWRGAISRMGTGRAEKQFGTVKGITGELLKCATGSQTIVAAIATSVGSRILGN